MYGLKAQKLLAPFRACGAKLAKVRFLIRNRFRVFFRGLHFIIYRIIVILQYNKYKPNL
nr:MAG TPA: hypothetical protein [Caudoviricetes sp.]